MRHTQSQMRIYDVSTTTLGGTEVSLVMKVQNPIEGYWMKYVLFYLE